MTPTGAGRFAPSPSADLHIGNLRTAVLAWLFARSTGRRFLMRVEDLDDRTHTDIADAPARRSRGDRPDLGRAGRVADRASAALRRRRRRTGRPRAAVRMLLQQKGYRAGAARAARAAGCLSGHLPGSDRRRTRGPAPETGRPPALRLRTDAIVHTVHDLLHGEYTGIVDDFVVRRGDGVAAYNLAVVVDDAAQGVDQVVRGDDLLPSSPRQAYLATLLGYPEPTYAHVALGAQRGRGAAGQARRRGDARRDRGGTGAGADRRIAGLLRDDLAGDARRVRPGCAAARTRGYTAPGEQNPW